MALSNMLLILITITSFADAKVKDSQACPELCTCIIDTANVNIDCENRTSGNSTVLSGEIDELLGQQQYANLSVLVITNSRLTAVPQSICKLSQLIELRFDRNRLARLPDNCLTQMSQLRNLSAFGNRVKEIQHGAFDGLASLRSIQLGENRIAAIYPNVFLGLKDIRLINLTINAIRTLDNWPMIVSSLSRVKKTRIRFMLNNNSITSFTNSFGWRFDCNKKKLHFNLYMAFNQIEHVTDMLDGWNLTVHDFKCLLYTDSGIHEQKPMMDLFIYGNPLDCNCKDYELYKLEQKYFKYSHIYKDTPCISPPELYNKTIRNIPLDQFVCNITDSSCPGKGKCLCVYRPDNQTIHAYCSDRNLSHVPNNLPKLEHASDRYYVDISNNPLITSLDNRSYMSNTAVFDAVNCSIRKVSIEAWKLLLNTQYVYLKYNQLKSMPEDISGIPAHFYQLSLGYNPWACTCKHAWMKKWLDKYRHNLTDHQSIYCFSPERLQQKSMIQIPDEDFCSDPNERLLIKFCVVAAALIGGIAVTLTIAVFVAHTMRLKMFARWKFHPFDRDECAGEDMEYDVFLCCSSDDYRPDALALVDILESDGYKVCFHERDFHAGDTIENNMSRAIERSKRTVCLMTIHFIRSVYCMREFEVALHHNVTVLRKKRLIVLMKFPNPPALCRVGVNRDQSGHGSSSLVTESLRQYLRQYTYIDYTAGDWLYRLRYALPIKGMLEEDDNDDKTPLLYESL